MLLPRNKNIAQCFYLKQCQQNKEIIIKETHHRSRTSKSKTTIKTITSKTKITEYPRIVIKHQTIRTHQSTKEPYWTNQQFARNAFKQHLKWSNMTIYKSIYHYLTRIQSIILQNKAYIDKLSSTDESPAVSQLLTHLFIRRFILIPVVTLYTLTFCSTL